MRLPIRRGPRDRAGWKGNFVAGLAECFLRLFAHGRPPQLCREDDEGLGMDGHEQQFAVGRPCEQRAERRRIAPLGVAVDARGDQQLRPGARADRGRLGLGVGHRDGGSSALQGRTLAVSGTHRRAVSVGFVLVVAREQLPAQRHQPRHVVHV